MIRIGFAPALDSGWVGGLNYYRNLFEALAKAAELAPEIALFAGTSIGLDWLPRSGLRLRVVRSKLFDAGSAANVARRVVRRLSGCDVLLARFVQDVDVLSHSGPLPGVARPRTIGWLADLQHRHLPELFSERELSVRDNTVVAHLRDCAVVLVSSGSARDDLLRYPEAAGKKIVVVRFVATPPEQSQLPDSTALRAKYSLPERYFYLPNQFWVHKNHRLVVDALRTARGAGLCVVCTGDTRDYRYPRYYSELEAAADEVKGAFRVLGLVPFADAAALMRDSVAVINPSRFEGWSTTVEEAKSLGKRVLLSDIPVHREQAPDRGRYFDPSNPHEMAQAMNEALAAYDPREESLAADAAASKLAARQRQFAHAYLDAVNLAVTS